MQTRRLPLTEFVALIAMTFAMVALSIDAMLPALPDIAAEISPSNVNRAQLVLTSFVFGMGVGTFFTGPLSDTFGRKPVLLTGIAVYVTGAALAASAQSLEVMIAARILQGLGVSGPRVVAVAIVRDLYEGRQMARIMSYAMMIFTLVPAVAPALGAIVIAIYGWRAVFLGFILWAILLTVWITLRQQETLPHGSRRPFSIRTLAQAIGESFSNRAFAVSTLAQTLALGMLFSMLSLTQQIFSQTYMRAESFPAWFALIAGLSAFASIINAQLVVRLGMRRMILVGFTGQIIISLVICIWSLQTALPFALYIFWTTSIFFMAGLVMGNLNALAMEPLGHIAGLAASVMGAVSTVLAVAIAVPVGLSFAGTPLPLAVSTLVLSIGGGLLIRVLLVD